MRSLSRASMLMITACLFLTTAALADEGDTGPCDFNGTYRVTMTPEIQGEVNLNGDPSGCDKDDVSCQNCFNEYAWQLFIALNWPVDASGNQLPSNADFGVNRSAPVTWETFIDYHKIFENPSTAPAWPGTATKTLTQTNLRSKHQADTYTLVDQNGKVVYYEIKVNKSEWSYITKNDLYNKEGIFDAFNSAPNTGILLPAGDGKSHPVNDLRNGSIEVKASWRIIPAGQESNAYWNNFKQSPATVEGQPAKVALVGLHILKKSPKLNQWAWATFEHKNNVPEVGAADPATQYSFYNKDAAAGYTPNWDSPPKPGEVKAVQVERINPIAAKSKSINDAVHKLFPATSVWKNYQLIDMQWPLNPTPLTAELMKEPLPDGKPTPEFLVNTTMETYLQTKSSGGMALGDFVSAENKGKSSCIGCHSFSAITPNFDDIGQANKFWYTDYSAIFAIAKAKNPK